MDSGDGKNTFKRIKDGELSDLLMGLLEDVDEIGTFILIYESKDPEDKGGMAIYTGGATSAQTNWMIDQLKQWLLS